MYRFVGEKTCIISSNNCYDKFLNLTEEDIVNCANNQGCKDEQLSNGDIKILKCQLDFGKGEEDPVEYVNFYTNKENIKDEVIVKKINSTEISLLTPSYFKEYIFRVYVKDKDKLDAAKNAFAKFCSEKTGESPNHYQKSANKHDK